MAPLNEMTDPNRMTQDQLKNKIATGDFTASEARQYNQMTGSNTGARDVALTSQDAMRNQDFQTAVTPQEVGMMKDAGIQGVNSERITLDTTAPVTPTPTQKPLNEVTDTSRKTEAPVVKIESIEQFKQKGANLPNLEQFIEDRYGSTATQEDGGVTSVINGEKFKWTIDEAGNPIKTSMGKVQEDMSAMDNADAIYTSLLAGQVIPETLKTTNNYVKAQNRFNQYNQFKNLNQSQYQQLLAQGKLIPGTQAYNDLMNDPVAKSNIIKAQNLNAINQNQKAEEKIASTENNQSDVILSNNPTVAQALEDGTLSVEEYQALTNTPDIAEKSKNVSKLREDYIRLKSDYDAVEDEVLEEFKGKGKSGSYLRAKIQARRNSLFKELSLSEQLYTSAMGELTTMKNDATALLNTNLQLYKEQQARQQQLEDRQYQEDLATRRMQQEYDYTYGDFNSQDPRIRDTAIRNAVAQLYTQYPIPGMEAPAVKEQKVKDLMAQGLTGQQAISQLEQEIRSTNRYKQMIAGDNKFGFQNIGDGTIAVTDPSTGQVKFESIQNVGTGITREQATSTYGSTPAVRNFNPGNIMDTGFGGQKVQGERFTRFNTPQEGFSALIAKIQNIQSGNSKVYSPNMTILEYISKYAPASDNNNPQAYANAIAKDLGVPVNSKIGELDPVKLASAHAKHEDRNSYKMLLDLGVITTGGSLGTLQETGTQYSQQVKDWGDNIINGIGGTKITGIKDENLRSQVSSYIAEKTRKQPNQNIATIYGVLDVLKELETHPGLNSAVGAFGLGASYIPGTDAKGFLAKLSQLEGKQFLEGIQQMKGMGALSNAEGQKVAAAASSLLDTAQSEADWKAELQKVKNLLEGKIKTTEEDAGIKFDIYGRPLNNTDTPGQQNTGTSTENAYNNTNQSVKDLRKNYFND